VVVSTIGEKMKTQDQTNEQSQKLLELAWMKIIRKTIQAKGRYNARLIFQDLLETLPANEQPALKTAFILYFSTPQR